MSLKVNLTDLSGYSEFFSEVFVIDSGLTSVTNSVNNPVKREKSER